MKNVVAVSPLADTAVDDLAGLARRLVYRPETVQEAMMDSSLAADAQVLILRSNVGVDAKVLDVWRDLQLVVRAGAGSDNLDLDTLKDRGIEVRILGGSHAAPAVAELGLCFAMALLRGVMASNQSLLDGHWAKTTGSMISGLTVGVWGFGSLGREVDRVFNMLGAQVLVLDHPNVPAWRQRSSQAELVDKSDVHMLCLPLRESTTRIIDCSVVQQMAPRRPMVVNLGRWDLIDYECVAAALAGGTLGGLAVDPVERRHLAELHDLRAASDNVIFSSHIGAQTHQTQHAIGQAVVRAVTGWACADEPPAITRSIAT